MLDALLRETTPSAPTLRAGHRVLDVIERSADGFRVVTNRGDADAPAVVLATGGWSLPKSGSDGAGFEIAQRLGHTIVPTTPALAPLVLDATTSIHAAVRRLARGGAGVWIDGAVAMRLRGALLWTHFGVSGPVALNASRHWLRAQVENRGAVITVSFCPGQRFADVDAEWIGAAASAAQRRRSRRCSRQWCRRRSPRRCSRRLAIDRRARRSRTWRATIDDGSTRALVEWPLPVTGTRGYGFAEATAGGVALDEIDPATMESRVCPGLFLVGEMLDVDGRIGGFNFQWAWSSAYVAGRAVAKAVAAHRPGPLTRGARRPTLSGHAAVRFYSGVSSRHVRSSRTVSGRSSAT